MILKALYLPLLNSKLQSQYEKALSNLRDKQSRLNYLSSFFETTKKKIEAAQQKIMECEKKLIDDEARSSFTLIPFFSNSMIYGKSSCVYVAILNFDQNHLRSIKLFNDLYFFNFYIEKKIDTSMEKLRKKYIRKQTKFKQVNKLRNTNSWMISNWQPTIRRRVRSGHEVIVTIESPTESHHTADTINFNNDDEEEDNWSDISVL